MMNTQKTIGNALSLDKVRGTDYVKGSCERSFAKLTMKPLIKRFDLINTSSAL